MDWVERDDLVRLILHIVNEELELSEILDQYEEERGYPPFHPVMMAALMLYSYCQGGYSSRRMARACKQRVDYLALTGMQKPDHRTINLFRQRHLEALSGLTDSDSRLMKTGDHFIQGYNAQAAVDAHRQIIVAQTLNNKGSDMHQM